MRMQGTALSLAICAVAGASMLIFTGLGGTSRFSADRVTDNANPPVQATASEKPNINADSGANDDSKSAAMAKDAAPEPAPPGVKPLLMVYGVNNYGYIDVCGCKHKKIRQGSITRRASLLSQLRLSYPDILLVDAGNTFFGRKEQRLKAHEKRNPIERAKVLVESYNRLGYHAATIGHFDLILGLDVLKELDQLAKFPIVCANYIEEATGELVFPPFTEVEIGGVKVGILGLTNNNLQPHYLKTRAPGTAPTDGMEAALKYVPELRQRNEIVIVMSQNDESFNRKLAAEVPGIDFLIDPFFNLGSSKIWVEKDELRESIGDTTLLRCDAQGARLGSLDLWMAKSLPIVDREATPPAEGQSSYRFKRYPIEPHFLEDPEIVQLVEAFRKGSKFINTAELPPLPHKEKYLTASTCQACHPAQYDWWQGTTHAHAFASLEKTGDEWRQDCIGCHVLGYGQTFLEPKDAEPYKDVQCESCHGLNPEHPNDPAAHKWPRIREQTCLTCHNKDQTLVEFNFFKERPKVACPPMTPPK